MADDEILRRLDEHMARGNEHMARGNELQAEGHEIIRRNNEVIAEFRQEMADVRFELRQWSLRGERVMQGMLAELADGRAVLADMRADIQANTRGLLALIDEMRGGGPAATGG